MYDSCVAFYSPLSNSPCLEISYNDITHVRPLSTGFNSPLPGYPILVLETAWLCHYIAFRDEEARDTFGEKVEDAIDHHIKKVEETGSLQEEDLRKARFWQGFQSLSESSLSSGTGKVSSFMRQVKRILADLTVFFLIFPSSVGAHFFQPKAEREDDIEWQTHGI